MSANPKKRTPESQDALAYAENIIATLRESFVVLYKSLRVRTANTAFYRDFRVVNEEIRQPVESPTVRALQVGVIIGLTTRTLRCSP